MAQPPRKTRIAHAVQVAIDPRLKDFRNFLFLIWSELGLPSPTRVQYDIATYLQHGPRRRMIQAFRGVGKSWETAAYVLWRLLLNPNERVLVVSASKDRSDSFSVFVKRLIDQVPILNGLRPDPSKGQRDSTVAFDVGPSDPHQAPSVRSVGITGQLTGGRASLIVADDIETPKNSLTLLMRERLGELVKEFDAVLTPDGEIVYLGTPQCEESVYNKLPERGYAVRIWPARYPEAKWLEYYGDRVAPFIREALIADPTVEGTSTDPARFTDVDLDERALSYGRSGFSLQFQLDTRLSDADRYPLRLADLIITPVDLNLAPLKLAWGNGADQVLELPSVGLRGDRMYRPAYIHKDFAEFTGAVMFIDPAGRGKDETSYAVVKVLNGMLYLTKVGGFRDGYSDEVLEALAKIGKRQKVNLVLIEPNFGDGMFLKLATPFFREHHPVRLEDSKRASTQKERRIVDTLEPIMNQHRLTVAEEVVREDFQTDDPHRQFLYQLTRMTRDRGALKHDDRIDAVAGAVAHWVDAMAQSTDRASDASREKLIDKELKKFVKHVIGHVPKKRGALGARFSM